MTPADRNWGARERRRFGRMESQIEMRVCPLNDPSAEYILQCQNLSPSGALAATRVELEPGEELDVRISSGHGEPDICMPAIVRRRDGGYGDGRFRVAIEFQCAEGVHDESIHRLVSAALYGFGDEEIREFVRLRSSLPMRYRRGFFSRWQMAVARDLSPTGMMFEADEPIDPDTHIKVDLRIVQDKTLSFGADVVGSTRHGSEGKWHVRALFKDASGAHRQRIAAFISDEMTIRSMRR